MVETQNLGYGAGPKEWKLKQGNGQPLQSMNLGFWSEAARAWMLKERKCQAWNQVSSSLRLTFLGPGEQVEFSL